MKTKVISAANVYYRYSPMYLYKYRIALWWSWKIIFDIHCDKVHDIGLEQKFVAFFKWNSKTMFRCIDFFVHRFIQQYMCHVTYCVDRTSYFGTVSSSTAPALYEQHIYISFVVYKVMFPFFIKRISNGKNAPYFPHLYF